jgi:hypothetical protein
MGLKLQAKQSQQQKQGPKSSIIEAEGGHLCLLLQTRTLTFCIVWSHGPNQIITISYFQIPQTFLEQS